MTKLRYYGINGSTYNWIQTWLTQRTQCVVLNSESSSPVLVMSGVPQGTVLGPLMFLLYINYVIKDINSPLRLFADDCLLSRVINSVEDINRLQEDLNKLSEWANTWQLKFNVSKLPSRNHLARTCKILQILARNYDCKNFLSNSCKSS